jgi:hypothetical protein
MTVICLLMRRIQPLFLSPVTETDGCWNIPDVFEKNIFSFFSFFFQDFIRLFLKRKKCGLIFGGEEENHIVIAAAAMLILLLYCSFLLTTLFTFKPQNAKILFELFCIS